MNMEGLLGYLVVFLTDATIFGVFALGLNLQFGFTGLINFGHVAFMGVGAYTMALLAMAGWPLVFAVLAGLAAAGLFGLVIALPSIRLREDYLAIVTIGSAEVVRLVLNNEAWLTGGALGMKGFAVPFDSPTLSPTTSQLLFLILCVAILATVFWALQRLIHSPWGRVLQAIREDEDVALSLGKNTVAYKIQSFVIGAVIAGLAGMLLAWYHRYVHPSNYQPLTTFTAWIIMVLGGTARNWGAVVGAVVYWAIFSGSRLLESSLGAMSGAQVGALRMMVIGIALVLLMIYRPQGLLGKKEELTLDR